MPKGWPTPYQFIILRLLSISLFRIPSVREFIKQSLVKLLITRKKVWPCSNKRVINLVKTFQLKTILIYVGYKKFKNIDAFIPIHMASQGYWQAQDENL